MVIAGVLSILYYGLARKAQVHSSSTVGESRLLAADLTQMCSCYSSSSAHGGFLPITTKSINHNYILTSLLPLIILTSKLERALKVDGILPRLCQCQNWSPAGAKMLTLTFQNLISSYPVHSTIYLLLDFHKNPPPINFTVFIFRNKQTDRQ